MHSGQATASRPANASSDAKSQRIIEASPFRLNGSLDGAFHLRRLDDLVVRIAELVAPRRDVFVARLVDGDLDRRAGERRHDLPVPEEVRPRETEVTGFGRIPEQALPAHVPPYV